MINVVIASAFGEENKKRIMTAGEGKCRFFEVGADTPANEAEKIMADDEVLIGIVKPALLAGAKKLKLLQATWAGVDAINGAVPTDVAMTNASGAFGPVIAEHMVACAMALARLIPA